MKRKQRKSLPRRRFGYVILIIIKIGDLLLGISLRIINALRNYIKQLVNKTQLRLVFFNPLFSVWISDETFSLCLIYDFSNLLIINEVIS